MLIGIFCYLFVHLLDIHLLVAKFSVRGLYGIMRYVLLCSGVYGIIAEIPCSITYLGAHSADLGLQTRNTLIQLHVTCTHKQVVTKTCNTSLLLW